MTEIDIEIEKTNWKKVLGGIEIDDEMKISLTKHYLKHKKEIKESNKNVSLYLVLGILLGISLIILTI